MASLYQELVIFFAQIVSYCPLPCVGAPLQQLIFHKPTLSQIWCSVLLKNFVQSLRPSCSPYKDFTLVFQDFNEQPRLAPTTRE